MIPGLLTAAGIAMSIVPSTIAATQGAKQGQAGLASGLVNTSRQVGGGLGLALLITLATQRTSHLIGTGVQVPQALTDGFRLAYLIGAGLAAAAALLTFVSVPKPAAALGPGGRDGCRLAIAVVVAGFIALDLAFAGSHGAPIGAYTTKGAYRFVTAPSLHPPKLTTDAPTVRRQAGAGLHPHRELLRPQLPADHRPERPADPRQPACSRSGFTPVPQRRRRRQPEPADLSGQAGARVVAGRRHEHRRDRERRGHRGQPALPDGRDADGQGRLEAHPPRVRDRRRRRMGDREQEHPDEPLEVRRRLQRRADRLGGAGVRPEDRQAAAHLGRARPHPAGRLLRDAADQRLPVGRLPRQLDRTCSATGPSSSRCATRGPPTWSTSRRARSSGRSAASTRASSSARARTSSGSTTSSCGPAGPSRCSTTTAAS